ncbi:hypothetical protein FNF27_07016 [Cafeteria roenbergensis]|uniref:UBC core domain-containing protein n=1 Tax=Cafeteria roenbergensis TaxID=33653 RepID=A0A5A8CY23_CAFRO|nr:hypothetical protein FNF29_07449 [Cafeteria roenbergensis]KAA0157337.1 hypothetical protein FNF31_05762 [Cafeteria roenbergensis]KAA0169197.1 hypothetical protein FNF27_07016 [Cafeteria roenbergensis]|eukprot:KAA0147280.1 hypothetical protein FNF29_07449 [Cafeteria roenbergensis]
MLGLRKKKADSAAAKEAAAHAAPAPAPAAAAAAGASAAAASSAAPKPAGGGISLLGVGKGGKAKEGGAKKMSAAERRVEHDVADMDAGKVASVEWPDKRSRMHFLVTVTPDSGLWKSASFQFDVNVPKAYPHEPPKVRCTTPIYHPNIDWEGAVCLNILRKDWKPVLDLNAVVYGLIMLFYEPNANDPLNHDVADEMRSNKALFERNVEASLRGRSVKGHSFPRLL